MAKAQDMTGQEVIALCETYMNERNVKYVKKALEFATEAHQHQKRMSGEPYIVHPIQVAGILAQLRMDPDTIVAGFLHDVVEDTDYTLEDIEEHFSKTVAFLVAGVTKIGKVPFQSKAESLAANHRKMLLSMAQDMRIIMVKLADRLHNMRTMNYQSSEKKLEKSQESMDVYAPLAARLGMNAIKWELEDISLRYLNEKAYYNIVNLMKTKREEREAHIREAVANIEAEVADLHLKSTKVYGRPKHIYSIYRKMETQHKEFDDLYDLLAVRVLVESTKDCYAVLGAVHMRWKPLPGRFKDYIAHPKRNFYQSLHTTVIGPHGKPLEIQIRTYDMHEVAENGVAAHWAYKEGSANNQTKNMDAIAKQLKWFQDLKDLQGEAESDSEYMEHVKGDIFADQVYVYTPKMEIQELPKGATALDFAFHIHTDVGFKTIGAKVNGKIVPLNYQLQNRDIVEVLTNSSSNGPSRDWLNYASTSKARNKIKRHFKLQNREKDSERGQEIFERELKERGYSVKYTAKKHNEKELLERFNFSSLTDMYASIGLGELACTTVMNFIEQKEGKQDTKTTMTERSLEQLNKQKRSPAHKIQHVNGVLVQGVDNLMLRLSRCCNPVPGDAIIGYVTRGRGISVHRQDCPNLLAEPDLMQRTMQVEWEAADKLKSEYITEVRIIGFSRNSLLTDVINVVTHAVKNVRHITADSNEKSNETIITAKIGISNIAQLEDIMVKLRNIPDVYEVTRVNMK